MDKKNNIIEEWTTSIKNLEGFKDYIEQQNDEYRNIVYRVTIRQIKILKLIDINRYKDIEFDNFKMNKFLDSCKCNDISFARGNKEIERLMMEYQILDREYH